MKEKEYAMIYAKKDDIVIRDSNVSSPVSMAGFIKDVMQFMGERSDPEVETAEAVAKSEKNGFCIEVMKDDMRIAVLVINRGVFNVFQPKYHLSYIAVDKNFQGKGIGRMLLEIACQLTENSIALHVGLGNKDAIAFYKKMNWEESYLRMIPKVWNYSEK